MTQTISKPGSLVQPARSCYDLALELDGKVEKDKDYMIDPNGGSYVDSVTVRCVPVVNDNGVKEYLTCIPPSNDTNPMDVFSYGRNPMEVRQLASLAVLSTRATQTITTTQTKVLGWNGQLFNKEKVDLPYMRSTLEDNTWTISTAFPNTLPFKALATPTKDNSFKLGEVCFV